MCNLRLQMASTFEIEILPTGRWQKHEINNRRLSFLRVYYMFRMTFCWRREHESGIWSSYWSSLPLDFSAYTCPEKNGRFPVGSSCDRYLECVVSISFSFYFVLFTIKNSGFEHLLHFTIARFMISSFFVSFRMALAKRSSAPMD